MAVRNRSKNRRSLLTGAAALAAALALLLAVALLLDARPQMPEPSTGAPEPSLPENPYGPADFGYEGEYLTCLTGPSVLGIDVSEYQQQVDWQRVRDAGVEFVIIRVGFRSYGTGALHPDAMAQAHYAGAKAAGLRVGAYFFSQAVSVEEAEEEAEYALSLVADWELDLPLAFDWEYISDTARTANVRRWTLTACTLAFCNRVEEAGREAMVYFNPSQGRDLLYLNQLGEYPFWLASYADAPAADYRVWMWQYTSGGTVPGISGPVDINLLLP